MLFRSPSFIFFLDTRVYQFCSVLTMFSLVKLSTKFGRTITSSQVLPATRAKPQSYTTGSRTLAVDRLPEAFRAIRGTAATTSVPRNRYSVGQTERILAEEIFNYPPKGINTVVNTCPEGKAMVIERFGKFHRVKKSGLYFCLPSPWESIAYIHDLRERAIRVNPQEATTRDNVSVKIGGNVFFQFNDPVKASYGASRPLYAVIQHAQSALRAGVGTMDLDELFHNRSKINSLLRDAITKAASAWGCEVKRFEITEVIPDKTIQQSMDLQAAAERKRREDILKARADKQSMELRSEGIKQSAINESEGNRQRVINEAQANAETIRLQAKADKNRVVLAAEADAQRIRLEADAQKERIIKDAEGNAENIILNAKATAQGISALAEELGKPEGPEALNYQLAKNYFNSFEHIVGKSNTIVVPKDVGNVSGMIASGVKVLEEMRK